MDFFKKRSFLFGAAYYCAISLAIILFSSPLFRSLGFEYCGFIAIFVSIHLLFYSSNFAADRKNDGIWNLIKRLSLPFFILSSVPLFVSAISSFFIPNCSLLDGILFYFEIVYPTAFIAMLCGIRIGIIPRSKTKTNIYLAIFWIATIILSLLPGYFSAKIYTFGWQYGYFPGFVWDEAMELAGGYWASRIIELAVIITWLIYDKRIINLREHSRLGIKNIFYSWQYWLMTIVCAIVGYLYYTELNDNEVNRFLSKQIHVSPQVAAHFNSGSLSIDEVALIKFDTKKYIEEIDSIYGIKSASQIDIYIFPSSDDLYEFVGTREASISKPWRRAIYITKQNLHSLKHEMAHIMLAVYGSFPFDISWSTGLTEGAAVAIENDYDGIRSVDEYSARMLQMKLADGVEQVMQPSGFLSSAPSQSYVLSGSFTKYLIEKYGSEKFLRLYKERDFDAIYHKPLSNLEQEWRASIVKSGTSMNHYDSLRMLFYFKRTSIIQQPCIRRIGKLFKNADGAFKNKDYKLADSLYEIIVSESGRGRAIQGRIQSLLHQQDFQGALTVLDTTSSAQEIKNKTALHLLRGDVIVLATGDLRKASDEWEEAIKLELSDSYFMSAFMHRYFFGGAKNVEAIKKVLRDIYSIDAAKDKYALLYSIEPVDYKDFAFALCKLYMYSSYISRTGALAKAYMIWKEGRDRMGEVMPDSSVIGMQLFEKLAAQKYLHYEEISKDAPQHSESKILP